MMAPLKKRRSGFGAKANFIRSQPASMSAKEIVDAAAEQGIRVSVNHVYNLRAGEAKPRDSETDIATADRGGRHKQVRGDSANVERQLRNAIAEVGLRRAREIFEEIAVAFRRA